MDTLIRQFRPDKNFSAEARLCAMGAFGDAMDYLGQKGKDALDKTKEAANTFGEWVTRGGEFALKLPANVGHGIYDAWHADTRALEIKNRELQTISEFSNTMPALVQDKIEEAFKNGQRPSFEQLCRLFSHVEWLQMFEDDDAFDQAQHHIGATDLEQGPQGIFYALSDADRQKLYFQYVSTIIPAGARKDKDLHTFFGAPTQTNAAGEEGMTPVEELTAETNNHRATINEAMKAMFGLRDVDPAAPDNTDEQNIFRIAKQGLMHRYWVDGQRFIGGTALPFSTLPHATVPGGTAMLGQGLAPRMKDEIKAALKGRMMIGNLQDFRQGIDGASLLKGALNPNLQIVLPEDIPEIEKFVIQGGANETMAQHKNQSEVNKYTGVVRREQIRNTETMGEAFQGLSGIEKLAFIGLATYLLTKSESARGGVGALATLYFGQKFLLDQKDPLNDSWKPLVKGLTKKATGNEYVKGFYKAIGVKTASEQYTSEDMRQRSILMSQFLKEHARADLDTSVTGFTLLADMTMADLATYMAITADGTKAVVKFWDRDFKTKARQVASDHDLNIRQVENFFGDAEFASLNNPAYESELDTKEVNKHVLESGQGLATVFYMLAVKSGDRETQDAKMAIEQFRGGSTFFGTYQELPDQDMSIDINHDGIPSYVNPRRLYVALVEKGRAIAKSMGDITLADHIAAEIHAAAGPTDREKLADKERRFSKIKTDIETYEYPAGTNAGLRVLRDRTGSIKVDLAPTAFASPLIMNLDEFVNKFDGKVLVQEWVARASIEARSEDIKKKMPPPTTLKHAYGVDFSIQRSPTDPQKVIFAPVIDVSVPNPLPVAETTVFKLMQASDQDLLTKYEIYEKAVGLGTIIAPADPL